MASVVLSHVVACRSSHLPCIIRAHLRILRSIFWFLVFWLYEHESEQTNKQTSSLSRRDKHRTQNCIIQRRKARAKETQSKQALVATEIWQQRQRRPRFFSSSFWLALCKVCLFSPFHRKSCSHCVLVSAIAAGGAAFALALRTGGCGWAESLRRQGSSPFHSLAHSPRVHSSIRSFVHSTYPFGYRSLPGHRSLAPSLPRSLADWPVGGLVG